MIRVVKRNRRKEDFRRAANLTACLILIFKLKAGIKATFLHINSKLKGIRGWTIKPLCKKGPEQW